MNDNNRGAAAYKADRAENAAADRRDSAAPFHLRLSRDRQVAFGYREAAAVAGALGLGYLAWRGVGALLGRSSDTTARRLDRAPLARSDAPAKDNAAPRFAGEDLGTTSQAPAAGGGAPSPAAAAPSPAKDNAAPRFGEEGTGGSPFVAAPPVDDTGDLAAAPADRSAQTPEHVPTDLMGDRPPTANDRAVDAFRPDPTAPVPDSMRESLRPATGPAPSLAANRGDFASGLAQTDGSK